MTAQSWPRIGIALPLALLVGLPVAGSVAAALRPELITQSIAVLTRVVHGSGSAGLVVVIAVQVLVATSGLLPASLVGVAAGALYGVEVGFVVAAGSLLIGALLTFWLSRSIVRPLAAKMMRRRPWLGHLDGVIARDGWKLVCLLRVSPVMPFAATSSALGLTSISTWPYLAGTLASLPALLGYVAVGSLTTALSTAWQNQLGLAHIALLAVGVLATGLVTLRVGRLVWLAVSGKLEDAQVLERFDARLAAPSPPAPCEIGVSAS